MQTREERTDAPVVGIDRETLIVALLLDGIANAEHADASAMNEATDEVAADICKERVDVMAAGMRWLPIYGQADGEA